MTTPTPLADARSFLFVPGNRPERFEKAVHSGADAIVLDLKDAVPLADIARHRRATRGAHQRGGPAAGAGVSALAGASANTGRRDVHEVLSPTAEEADWTRRVIAADAASGGAAVQMDARLVDLPVVLQARRLLMRCELWSHAYFLISPREADMVKIPRPLVDRFIDSLCYAA